MKIIQVSGQSPRPFIFSIDMHATDVQVMELSVYRHAGDSDEAKKDSWFLELLVKVDEWQSPDHVPAWDENQRAHSGYIHVAQKATREHGLSYKQIHHLLDRIKAAGKVNLEHWWYSH